MSAPVSSNEAERLRELDEFDVLDTAPEQEYDDLIHLASQICGTPIALMSLVDENRQWWKSRIGLPGRETHRDLAFCAHAILQPDVMEVKDASKDQRFADNPLVTSDPSIRFYAGAPMLTSAGNAMGTLCVIDRVPRELTEDQKRSLTALSRQASMLLELRRAKKTADTAHRQSKDLLEKLRGEQEKSDRLLASLFPPSIAEQLRSQPCQSIAEEHPHAGILFAGLTNFWQIAGKRKPPEVIDLLNRVFSHFDQLVTSHGIEKVKTIGDIYMAVGGLPGTCPAPLPALADLALSMQREIVNIDTGSRQSLELRIGIHSGPVIAGVIGTRRLAYDLWGPTVELADQMQSSGVPGGVQVSSTTYELLQDDYLFEPRGEFYVPDQGEVSTYLLTGRAAPSRARR